MTNPELRILIRAIDKASATLNRVGRNANSMGDDLEGAAHKARPLGRALVGIGAAGTALIGASVLTAAKVETLGIVLDTVGQNAGYSKDEIAAFDAGVQSMGITTRASRQSLLHMAQANLDLGRATDLARLAQDAAVIANINSSVAYEKLVRGIQQGRTIILRTMGLNVDFQASYARMAKQLGVTTVELTRSQKMTARLNEVLEVGARISGTYEDAMGSVGKQLSSLPRFYEEAGLALGQNYMPELETLVEVQTELLETFIALEPEQQKVIANFIAGGAGATVLTGGLILVIPKIYATIVALKALAGWAAGAKAGTVAFGAGVAWPVAAIAALTLGVKELLTPVDSAAEAMSELDEAAAVLPPDVYALVEAELKLEESLRKVTDGWYTWLNPAMEYAREQTDGWANSVLVATTNTDILEAAVIDLSPVVKGLADDFSFSAEQALGLALQMGLTDQAAIDLAVELGFLTQAEADLRVAQLEYTQALVDGDIGQDEYTRKLRESATQAIVLDRDTRIAAGGVEVLKSGVIKAGEELGTAGDRAHYFDRKLRNIPPVVNVDINWFHRVHGSRPDTTPGGPQQYASGTDYVPQTGYAFLHKGEAVLTAEENRRRPDGSRSTTTTVIVHNHFGHDSIRSEQDILDIANQIEHTLALRGLQRAL